MNKELNLLQFYPSSTSTRFNRTKPSKQDIEVSKKFDKEYFDGTRQQGYGGYSYNPKYWMRTAQFIIDKFQLNSSSSILDVGCAKGFLLKDLLKVGFKGNITGIDISHYAITNCEPEVKNKCFIANAKDLPFKNNTFDLVLSINTIHNLNYLNCLNALSEIERVSKKDSFVMVDGWDSEDEKKELENWILTAETVLSREEWLNTFEKANFTGYYFLWKKN